MVGGVGDGLRGDVHPFHGRKAVLVGSEQLYGSGTDFIQLLLHC